LNDLPDEVREAIARVLLVVLVLLLIWIMRRMMTWVIIRPLRRVVHKTGRAHDDIILEAAIQPIRYIIIAIAILISAQILAVGNSVDTIINHVGRSMVIVGILLLFYRLVDLFAPTSNRLFSITGITLDERLMPFMRTSIKLFVIALGLVIVLQEWGYDVSGLIAGLGLGGLAFSLAAQDTVSNLFGFAALVSDRPFNVGEYISTSDVEGVVEHVGLRSTQVRRMDQAIVYVPNRIMADSAILNWSRLKKRRIDYTLGITYDADSGQVRVLLHRLREYLKVQPLLDPESVAVYFINFGDSSLDILVRSYALISDWGKFTSEKERLNLAIMDIVEELGLVIAFPSTSLYVENLPEILGKERSPQERPKLSDLEQALMTGEISEKQQKFEQMDETQDQSAEQDMPDEGSK